MDQWAPMLEGYEAHDKQSDTDSVWTLRGDLGPFSKTVKLKVQITEWTPPSGEAGRVAFTLEGIDEVVTGSGAFDLSEDVPPPPPEPPARSLWQRLMDWLLGRSPELPQTTGPTTCHVVFTFTVDAGGPMGPMINAMLGPYAEQVAQGLLEAVGAHLENAQEAA
jgi:hypothetical protein